MKTAFVHDRLISIGGGETVFLDMIGESQFDEAEIFTVFSNMENITVNNKVIKINKIISSNFLLKKIGYRNFMPLFPILVYFLSQKIKKYNPDKTIISSFAISKNIDINGYKSVYMHSPMQYIWANYEEYVSKFKGLKKLIYIIVSKYLRKRDLKYKRFDEVFANSKYTQGLVKEIYGIDSKIKYPQIHKDFLDEEISLQKKDYFVFAGRLVKFVREVEKIIELFNKTGDNLLIMGSGPDEFYLQSIAKGNIIFLGYLDNNNPKDREKRIKITKQARGFINIAKESFGMATAEALSLGIPVFGYNQGGTQELVDESSGLLVNSKDSETLLNEFEKFKKMNFDSQKIKDIFMKKYLSQK